MDALEAEEQLGKEVPIAGVRVLEGDKVRARAFWLEAAGVQQAVAAPCRIKTR